MAYKLLCPECYSDSVEPYFSQKQKNEKFKCNRCGVVRLMSKMQYEETLSSDTEAEKGLHNTNTEEIDEEE